MICHLIDANLGTAYFRSIAQNCDRQKFPVMIGSIAPAGALQSMLHKLRTPSFSLQATSRRQYSQALWRLTRLLRREKIALLHAHCFDPTWLGLIAARLAGIPFVFTRHHSDHHIRINKHWHTRVDGWCARQADHVIAVSHITRQIMMEVENVPASQITMVYNGMEPLCEPTAEHLAKVRREMRLADEKVCLMIGRLHEEKGHRYLFEAIPEVIDRCGAVQFWLLGEGQHRAQLENEAQARGLENCVRFLGWRDDVAEMISLSSLVVMPSLAESFGFAALEAMCLGKPVVAAATGGLTEVVTDGITGLLVPQRNAPALASAICRVLLNTPAAHLFGTAGRSRAAEFSFERMIRYYEAIYAGLLHPRTRMEISNVEPTN